MAKNWYDFNQVAFNSFPKNNEYTVRLLKRYSKPEDRIMVLTNDSASYFWDSERLPYGYFINFFPWYNESERLRGILEDNLKIYNGKFLIIDRKPWNDFCTTGKTDSWINPYLNLVNTQYELFNYNVDQEVAEYDAKNLTFKKKQVIEPVSYQCLPQSRTSSDQ